MSLPKGHWILESLHQYDGKQWVKTESKYDGDLQLFLLGIGFWKVFTSMMESSGLKLRANTMEICSYFYKKIIYILLKVMSWWSRCVYLQNAKPHALSSIRIHLALFYIDLRVSQSSM
ncbi:uncharacterized protein LOC108252413 [Diaphorina citri]|uniref:Uncharacterized protein LOC108252413 n=1 Tax=Diaphorina citri TaxID=121845 RepID=A0A3Q0ITB5_DIACI|nr:uncharacterized protein LOC108252413 [Diaphorina citri]